MRMRRLGFAKSQSTILVPRTELCDLALTQVGTNVPLIGAADEPPHIRLRRTVLRTRKPFRFDCFTIELPYFAARQPLGAGRQTVDAATAFFLAAGRASARASTSAR